MGTSIAAHDDQEQRVRILLPPSRQLGQTIRKAGIVLGATGALVASLIPTSAFADQNGFNIKINDIRESSYTTKVNGEINGSPFSAVCSNITNDVGSCVSVPGQGMFQKTAMDVIVFEGKGERVMYRAGALNDVSAKADYNEATDIINQLCSTVRAALMTDYTSFVQGSINGYNSNPENQAQYCRMSGVISSSAFDGATPIFMNGARPADVSVKTQRVLSDASSLNNKKTADGDKGNKQPDENMAPIKVIPGERMLPQVFLPVDGALGENGEEHPTSSALRFRRGLIDISKGVNGEEPQP